MIYFDGMITISIYYITLHHIILYYIVLYFDLLYYIIARVYICYNLCCAWAFSPQISFRYCFIGQVPRTPSPATLQPVASRPRPKGGTIVENPISCDIT